MSLPSPHRARANRPPPPSLGLCGSRHLPVNVVPRSTATVISGRSMVMTVWETRNVTSRVRAVVKEAPRGKGDVCAKQTAFSPSASYIGLARRLRVGGYRSSATREDGTRPTVCAGSPQPRGLGSGSQWEKRHAEGQIRLHGTGSTGSRAKADPRRLFVLGSLAPRRAAILLLYGAPFLHLAPIVTSVHYNTAAPRRPSLGLAHRIGGRCPQLNALTPSPRG